MFKSGIVYPSSLNGGGGGGGGSFVSVIGTPNEIAYFNSAGNGTSDPQFTRLDDQTKRTNAYSNTFAGYALPTSGGNNQVNVLADFVGAPGNSIALVADGVDDVATIIAAWNVGQPGNTVSLDVGQNPTDVPDAGTYTLFGGGPAGFTSGTVVLPVGNFQGFGAQATDATSGITAVHTVGNLSPIVGKNEMSLLSGVIDATNNLYAILLAFPGLYRMQGTDGVSNTEASLQVGGGTATLYYRDSSSDLALGVTSNAVQWGDNGAGEFFRLPLSPPASTSYILGVTATGGGLTQLGWVLGGGGGGLPSGTGEYQFLKWDTGTAAPIWNQLYAITDDSTSNLPCIFGYKSLAITNGSPGYAGTYSNTSIGNYALTDLLNGIPSDYSRNTALGMSAGAAIGQASKSIFIGYQAKGNGASSSNSSILIGADTTLALLTDSVFIGADGQVGGTDQTAVGCGSQIFGSGHVAIGKGNFVTGTNNVAIGTNIGLNSAVTSQQNILIGGTIGSSLTGGSGNIMMGFGGPGNITAGVGNILFWGGNNISTGNFNFCAVTGSGQTLQDGINNILIGAQADVLNSNTSQAIALGWGSIAASNQFVAGSNTMAITDVWFGNGRVANGDWTLHGSEAMLPTPAVDTPGGALNILAGRGNGSAYGGALRIGSSLTNITGPAMQNPSFWGIVLDPNLQTLELGDPSNALNNNQANLVFDYAAKTMKIMSRPSGNILHTWDTFGGQSIANGGLVEKTVRQVYGAGMSLTNADYGVVFCNSGSGPSTVTLPPTPTEGQKHEISDGSFQATADNITVDAGSGNTITSPNGIAQTHINSINGQSFTYRCFDNNGGSGPNKWMVV